MRIIISVLIVFASVALADDAYVQWKKRLPLEAKAFRDADDIYWRQWYQRGFSPEFAWKNTDPKSVHTMSRPQLKSEREN